MMMNARMTTWTQAAALIVAAAACGAPESGSNIEADGKYAWAENLGWLNWRDADDGAAGVVIGDEAMSGWIWSENAGWISVGDGDAPYANQTADNYGVNIRIGGWLSGYGWGENIGWINFGTVFDIGADGARVLRAEDGEPDRLVGFAWSENAGWINLGAPAVTFSPPCPGDVTGDLEVNFDDLNVLLENWGGAGPAGDVNGDGSVNFDDLNVLLERWGDLC